MSCLCEHAIEQQPGEPIKHDPRCESKPSNVSARITPQGKAYIEWLKTDSERSTFHAFAAGWRAGKADPPVTTLNLAPKPRPYYGICVESTCPEYARGQDTRTCKHCGRGLARVERTEREE